MPSSTTTSTPTAAPSKDSWEHFHMRSAELGRNERGRMGYSKEEQSRGLAKLKALREERARNTRPSSPHSDRSQVVTQDGSSSPASDHSSGNKYASSKPAYHSKHPGADKPGSRKDKPSTSDAPGKQPMSLKAGIRKDSRSPRFPEKTSKVGTSGKRKTRTPKPKQADLPLPEWGESEDEADNLEDILNPPRSRRRKR
ncbi:MAG: hypothetical protein M1820_005924 [Bogoriella megaspora]|nr:MAG: hypothetical protein M1820_005924 [Bogoriella megaspora]